MPLSLVINCSDLFENYDPAKMIWLPKRILCITWCLEMTLSSDSEKRRLLLLNQSLVLFITRMLSKSPFSSNFFSYFWYELLAWFVVAVQSIAMLSLMISCKILDFAQWWIDEMNLFFSLLQVPSSHCGNFMIFLSLRFYVKSNLVILEVENMPL